MTKENEVNTVSEVGVQEFAIDKLLAKFHNSVDRIAGSFELHLEMEKMLVEYNPNYVPVAIETKSKRAKVLAQVVAGIYAPLIHGFTQTVLKNIQDGSVSENIVAPPRDAIPLAVSLRAYSETYGVTVNIMMPHINRNTAGIANNQKLKVPTRDPLLDLHLDQEKTRMNGRESLVEIETGIYGTTSLVMAEAFKARGVRRYIPLKFYGLGPNLSYVHALLSAGKEWIAERVNLEDSDFRNIVGSGMVILDTMEELGMEKHYRSVEKLERDSTGLVVPKIVPAIAEDQEIARVTNLTLLKTAGKYRGIGTGEVLQLLKGIPQLVEQSQSGMPFTLTNAIPSMDSKEEHFENIRKSKLFDYPALIL